MTTDLDRSVSRRFGTLTDWSIDLGFDMFVFWPTTAPLAQLEVFATEVVPGVRQRVSERRGQPRVHACGGAARRAMAGADGRLRGMIDGGRDRDRSHSTPERPGLC